MGDRTFAFGTFVVDVERRILLNKGVPVPMGHRGLALLSALLEAGGRVVGKSDLMDVAWPAQQVEESNLSVQIAAIRRVLGVKPDGEDWISTVPRVGYQFLNVEPNDTEDHSPVRAAGTDIRPSIAVLPFTNLSASREHEFFADGMTDDIVAALSRIGGLLVNARRSSHARKSRDQSAKEAANELGVRYILDGSIRATEKQVRVTAQLTDAWSDSSIWAERYDGSFDDIFAFQDDLTRNIVQALQVRLSAGEAARLWEGQTKNLRAWEKAVLAHQIFQRYSTADNETARSLLEEALAIDPSYTGAMAWIGVSHYWDARYSLSVDRVTAIGKAERCAAAIEALDPSMGKLYTLRSSIAFVRGEYEAALHWGRQAVNSSPADSRSHGFLGMFQIYAGQTKEALASFKHAMRHSPQPDDYLIYYLGIIHMWLGQYDKALEHALENQRRERDEPYSMPMWRPFTGFVERKGRPRRRLRSFSMQRHHSACETSATPNCTRMQAALIG